MVIKMKRNIWAYGAILFLFFTSISVIQVHADPSLIITDYDLSPSIFLPGDIGILTLTITNTESTNTVTLTSTSSSSTTVKTDTIGATISNIWIEPAFDHDKRVRATLNYEDVGDLAPGASVDISFKIIIDENMSEGVYFPIANVDVENYEDIKYPIEVKVSNDSVELVPTGIPSKISKSGATDVFFSVVNTRENTIKNIQIIPTISDGIDIIPEKIVLESLDVGSSQPVHFSLIPNEIGNKEITFETFFKNGENEHKSSSKVSVTIVDALDVAPIIYSFPSKIETGVKKSIRLKIYNSKTEDISSVIVTPITNVRLTPSQYFIGTMDADDVYSVSFDIDTTGLKVNQTFDIGFSVSFKQDGTTFNTPPVMSSFTVISNNGNGNEAAISIGFFFIIVIISIYLGYRWRKKQLIKKFAAKQS
jgi:hypothetical protein